MGNRATRRQLLQLLGFTGLALLLFSAAIVAGVGLDDEWPEANWVCLLALPGIVAAFVHLGSSLVGSRYEDVD